MKTRAVVRLEFSSEKHLEVAWRALKPEVKRPATSRSRERLEKDGLLLVLKVETVDTVALRAALNAYLRWINLAKEVLNVLEKH